MSVKSRAAAALRHRQHAEQLATLILLSAVEISVELRLAYDVMGVLFCALITTRDMFLLVFFAEEIREEDRDMTAVTPPPE
jgi:hypothetical protein